MRQQYFFGFIQRCLDYIFISQNFQEIAKHTEILNAIITDHLFQNLNQFQSGPGLLKFHNTLVSNEEYLLTLKELIIKIKEELYSQ